MDGADAGGQLGELPIAQVLSMPRTATASPLVFIVLVDNENQGVGVVVLLSATRAISRIESRLFYKVFGCSSKINTAQLDSVLTNKAS